jgi:hypothetical protein
MRQLAARSWTGTTKCQAIACQGLYTIACPTACASQSVAALCMQSRLCKHVCTRCVYWQSSTLHVPTYLLHGQASPPSPDGKAQKCKPSWKGVIEENGARGPMACSA